jgi:hypothetical protein
LFRMLKNCFEQQPKGWENVRNWREIKYRKK